MHKLISLLTLLPFLLFAEQTEQVEGGAEDTLTDEQAYIQWMLNFEQETTRQTGEIELLNGNVKLNIPEEFYYLDQEDTKRVLEEAWGNPPSDFPILGMLFPAKYSPLDEEAWGVTIEYSDDGYVKDDDAGKTNYDKLLKDMKKEAVEANKMRREMGYGGIELVGWAEPPYYDSAEKKLFWAKNLKFEGAEENTLNYNIRVLGREGYLLMNFIAGMTQLDQVKEATPAVLGMANFTEGNTYADHKPGLDKVAAYGIGGLVAGKVLAKTGLLAKILIVTKKFWIVGAIAIGGFFKKLTGRSKDA